MPVKIIFIALLISFGYSNFLFADKDSLYHVYFTQAEAYRKNALPDSAIIFYNKAADRSKSLGLTEDFINAYNQIGAILTRQDKYAEAKEYLNQALVLGEAQLDKYNLMLAHTYLNLGVVYSAENDYKTSLDYHFKSLKIRYQKFGDYHRDVSTSYGNIGNVYFRMKEYSKAIEAHLKAKKGREQIFGLESMESAQTYQNLGNAYKGNGEYKLALEYYNKTLKIKLTNNAPEKDLKKLYESIGEVYELIGDKEQAEFYRSKM